MNQEYIEGKGHQRVNGIDLSDVGANMMNLKELRIEKKMTQQQVAGNMKYCKVT